MLITYKYERHLQPILFIQNILPYGFFGIRTNVDSDKMKKIYLEFIFHYKNIVNFYQANKSNNNNNYNTLGLLTVQPLCKKFDPTTVLGFETQRALWNKIIFYPFIVTE